MCSLKKKEGVDGKYCRFPLLGKSVSNNKHQVRCTCTGFNEWKEIDIILLLIWNMKDCKENKCDKDGEWKLQKKSLKQIEGNVCFFLRNRRSFWCRLMKSAWEKERGTGMKNDERKDEEWWRKKRKYF